MTDTVTAPAAEKPVSIVALKQLADQLRERAASDDTTLGQVVELTAVKRELEAALKSVKEALEPRHDELLAEFATEGVSSKRHAESGKLVYIQRQVWARAATSKPAAVDALRAAGLGDYVEEGFNTHSLSAYFREQVKEREADGQPVTDLDDLLPEPLRGQIALTEDHKVGVRS